MIKIPRMSDRFRLKIDGATFLIAPLSQDQRLEISQAGSLEKGEYVQNIAKMQSLYLKYGLKEITGIKGYDKKDYCLSYDGDYLSEECLSEVMYLPMYGKLMDAAFQLFNGVPDAILDNDGKPLKGVKLDILPKKEAPP